MTISEPETHGNVKVLIYWPKVKDGGRMIPDLARSIRIWLRRHGLILAESPVISRPSTAASVEYVFTKVPVSKGGLRDTYVYAEAYPNADGTGVVLAYGSSPAFAVKSGSNPAQVVYLVSTAKEVRITLEPATIRVGSTFTAKAFAVNEADQVVPVPPFNWHIVSGSDVVQIVGSSSGEQITLKALKVGTAVIEAATEQQEGKPESRISGTKSINVVQ